MKIPVDAKKILKICTTNIIHFGVSLTKEEVADIVGLFACRQKGHVVLFLLSPEIYGVFISFLLDPRNGAHLENEGNMGTDNLFLQLFLNEVHIQLLSDHSFLFDPKWEQKGGGRWHGYGIRDSYEKTKSAEDIILIGN